MEFDQAHKKPVVYQARPRETTIVDRREAGVLLRQMSGHSRKRGQLDVRKEEGSGQDV